MDEKCENCIYFIKNEVSNIMPGNCRYNSPIQPFYNQPSYFPITSSESWCGRFETTNHIETCSLSIDKLELTVRSSNCMREVGIKTIGDLLKISSIDLMKESYNFGKKSRNEVKEILMEKFDINWK